MNKLKDKEIIGIQYLRGIAAVAVVIDHASGMAEANKYFGKNFADGILKSGAIGVDLFFIISGFIICLVSLEAKNFNPKISIASFFKNRFIRIIPIMWVAILSYAILRLFGRGESSLIEYFNAAFLIPAGDVEPRQIWTLRHEAIFYILFAISLLGEKRRLLVLFAWFLSPFIYNLADIQEKPQNFFAGIAWIIFNPSNIEFMIGFFVGILWLRGGKFFAVRFSFGAEFILTLLMICMIFIDYFFVRHYSYIEKKIFYSAAFLPILFISINVVRTEGFCEKLYSFLGESSYSIYLFHLHFLSLFMGVWSKIYRDCPVWIVIVATSFLCIFFGGVIHIFIEKPLIIWVRNCFLKSKIDAGGAHK